MNFNLPIVNVPPMSMRQEPSLEPTSPPVEDYAASDSMVIGVPETHRSPHQIYVYAESIQGAGAVSRDDGIATFDVVFCVSITEGSSTSTYKVIRRLALDKVKLACEAECAPPVSVVEDKEVERKAAASAQAKRARQIAGLE